MTETIVVSDVPNKKDNTAKINVSLEIKKQFPAPKGIILRITHLWDNRYSLNYWGKKQTKKTIDNAILARKVITVNKIDNNTIELIEDKKYGFNDMVKQVI